MGMKRTFTTLAIKSATIFLGATNNDARKIDFQQNKRRRIATRRNSTSLEIRDRWWHKVRMELNILTLGYCSRLNSMIVVFDVLHNFCWDVFCFFFSLRAHQQKQLWLRRMEVVERAPWKGERRKISAKIQKKKSREVSSHVCNWFNSRCLFITRKLFLLKRIRRWVSSTIPQQLMKMCARWWQKMRNKVLREIIFRKYLRKTHERRILNKQTDSVPSGLAFHWGKWGTLGDSINQTYA